MMMQGVNASTFGFLFGSFISDPITCLMVAYFFTVLIYFGGGPFYNHKGNNNYAMIFFEQISPFRYASEIMMRVMLNDVPHKDWLLNYYEHTEDEKCLPKLFFFFILCFSISWTAL